MGFPFIILNTVYSTTESRRTEMSVCLQESIWKDCFWKIISVSDAGDTFNQKHTNSLFQETNEKNHLTTKFYIFNQIIVKHKKFAR